MKFIVPAVDVGNFDTKIHDNFGRANYFVVFDTDDSSIEFFNNSAAAKSSGAGVAAAQLCSDKDADAVAAYHFGPKAFAALKAADIEVLALNEQKLLKEAYNDYRNGKLEKASPGHGGL
ncbi:MAG: NifB/NifX family molybdenum-iron cluster-binding protein [Halanaerobium sp.]